MFRMCPIKLHTLLLPFAFRRVLFAQLIRASMEKKLLRPAASAAGGIDFSRNAAVCFLLPTFSRDVILFRTPHADFLA